MQAIIIDLPLIFEKNRHTKTNRFYTFQTVSKEGTTALFQLDEKPNEEPKASTRGET